MRAHGVKRLDFQRFFIAFRVVALAGQFRCLLGIGTYIAAVILSGRSRTVAGRVFAFFRCGHKSSPLLEPAFSRLQAPLCEEYAPRFKLR
jgi:hypothetical protein